jgi:hypothetical protein
MMSVGIGWNIVGRGEWGFPKQYRGYLSCEGRGDGAWGVACFHGLDVVVMGKYLMPLHPYLRFINN